MNTFPSPHRGKYYGFFAFLLGVGAVLGAGVAVQATDNAKFCGSCHSMTPALWTVSTSIHADLLCNDCHTPNNLVEKLPYKAKVGLYDLYVTATGTIPDTLTISAEMKGVVQENCIRCHGATIEKVDMTTKPYCTDCHRSIPHNNKLPMAKREAADV